ncbi:MAG: serine/threonine-protein kinase [Deltaproteobacteria bacterium]|nr:serine/threonine-protein kinase [Deltaproteobacteria bacterium]
MTDQRDRENMMGKTALGSVQSAPPAAVSPNTVLLRGQQFRGVNIRNVLGSGAMGIAYLASHASLKMPVVIKLFRITMDDPLAEAHLAARIVSSSVVPVLDAGLENGVPYIMQRYVDGIDLDELLRIHIEANREIPLQVLIRLGVEIYRGLSAIHVAGVIHRDIKPANLFLSGAGRALVGDFGIAVDPHKAHKGELAGTPMFIAPEVWRGEQATPRADLYSAAATLHTLWQRRAPFDSLDVATLETMHREHVYEPPVTTDPVGAYFGAVLGLLLSKDIDKRPSSALAASRMLERLQRPAPELRGHEDGFSRVGDVMIAVEVRDISTARTDVIVSAANEELKMRIGVAKALREAGSDAMERDAMEQGPVPMGQVVWTRPYNLGCNEVAHAVAAMDGAICIQRAVLRTLFEAERRGHRTITFPALGTGVGGVPHGLGAQLTLEAIRTFAGFQPRNLRSVRIALPTPDAAAIWGQALLAMDADAVPT